MICDKQQEGVFSEDAYSVNKSSKMKVIDKKRSILGGKSNWTEKNLHGTGDLLMTNKYEELIYNLKERGKIIK